MCNIPIYFYNIHIKQLQYTSESLKNLKDMLASCAFITISPFVEVVRRGDHGVDSGHNLPVGNGDVNSTPAAPRRVQGTWHGAQ
jgi:hypothetical protein